MNALIRTTKEGFTDVTTYGVYYNVKRRIGSVKRYERYLWEVEPSRVWATTLESQMISGAKTKREAVRRLVEAFEASQSKA